MVFWRATLEHGFVFEGPRRIRWRDLPVWMNAQEFRGLVKVGSVIGAKIQPRITRGLACDGVKER